MLKLFVCVFVLYPVSGNYFLPVNTDYINYEKAYEEEY